MWGALNLWPTTRERASWLGLFLTAESKVLSVPTIWMCNTDTDSLNCSILMYYQLNCMNSNDRRKYSTHCSQQYKVSGAVTPLIVSGQGSKLLIRRGSIGRHTALAEYIQLLFSQQQTESTRTWSVTGMIKDFKKSFWYNIMRVCSKAMSFSP